jgi:hypothetical protein
MSYELLAVRCEPGRQHVILNEVKDLSDCMLRDPSLRSG